MTGDINRDILHKSNQIDLLTHDLEKARRELELLNIERDSIPENDVTGRPRDITLDEPVLEQLRNMYDDPQFRWRNNEAHIPSGDIVYKIDIGGIINERTYTQTRDTSWFRHHGLYISSLTNSYIYLSKI
jgi:hypothetical protein